MNPSEHHRKMSGHRSFPEVLRAYVVPAAFSVATIYSTDEGLPLSGDRRTSHRRYGPEHPRQIVIRFGSAHDA